jgi:hypothetical protein
MATPRDQIDGGNGERLRALKRKLWIWGGIFLVAQGIAAYALFGQFIPTAREYKRLKGQLELQVIKKDGALGEYRKLPNLIVDAGETFLRDAWKNTVELEIMKFHGIGTGAVAAAEANTGCGTELTTQYNPDSTRATGSLENGAGTNVFRTVGTNTVDASVAVTEWCLMSQATTGGGTLFSRVVFSAINLASGDSLQTTWDLTVE